MNSKENLTESAKVLIESHDFFLEKALNNRRFTHADILPLIEKLKVKSQFEVSEIGHSVENRAIYQVKIGAGPVKILLWSQMHGDEATATMAFFDLFKYFEEKSIKSEEILRHCTLYFVPMLNPDGAERFIRRNALGVDLNRDALATVSPEAKLLKCLQQNLKPDFGFNMHDMMPRYSAGKTGNLASIAFLATAFNEAREMNETRKKAVQVIVCMNKVLQNIIPAQIGRWSDDFEPRAFGDNIQKWGTSLILVESGGYKNDAEKQYLRKLHFVALISAFDAIACATYKNENLSEYENIPENGKSIFDILIKNTAVVINGNSIKADLGLNKEEGQTNPDRSFAVKYKLDDFGDLSTFFGNEEIDGSNMEINFENTVKIETDADFELKNKNNVILKFDKGTKII